MKMAYTSRRWRWKKIADERRTARRSKGQSSKENRDENIKHALLRVLVADFDDFLTVSTLAFTTPSNFDVGFYEFHCTISARGDGCVEAPVNQ